MWGRVRDDVGAGAWLRHGYPQVTAIGPARLRGTVQGRGMHATPPLPWPVIQRIRSTPGRIIDNTTMERLGHDRFQVADWVRDGRLERLAPAWCREPGDEAPHQAAHLATAYLRRHRPDELVIISGDHALGLQIPDHQPTGSPMALVEHGRRVRTRQEPWQTVQCHDLSSVPTTTAHGLTIARSTRSLADHAAGPARSDGAVRELVYLAINRLRLSPAELVAGWSTMDHPGARRLLELAADGSFEHESPAERDCFLDIFSPHPPVPDCQVWIAENIRADFAYLFAALVMEYHGEETHAGTVDRDATKQFAARSLGYDHLVITKSVRRDPRAVALHVHEVRRRREDLMLRGQLRRPPLPPQPTRLTPLRTLVPLG